MIANAILDACWNALEREFGVSFQVLRDVASKQRRGILDRNPVVVDVETGGQVISQDPKLIVRSTDPEIDVGERIAVNEMGGFVVQSRTKDESRRMVTYELEKDRD